MSLNDTSAQVAALKNRKPIKLPYAGKESPQEAAMLKTTGKSIAAEVLARGLTSPAPKTIDIKTATALAGATAVPVTKIKTGKKTTKTKLTVTAIAGVLAVGDKVTGKGYPKGATVVSMTPDPKKAGIPVELQVQNRKPLTPAQEAKMKAAAKPHPADATIGPAVTAAAYFTVAILAKGAHQKIEIKTLGGAREARPHFEAVVGGTRKGLIYAVSKAGMSTLIPDSFDPGAKTAPKGEDIKQAVAGHGKPPKAKKPAKKAKESSRYPWEQAAEAAAKGKVPAAPNFSAPTHARFRPALEEVRKMAAAKDVAGLKKFKFSGFLSSSPKTVLRYRDLCVQAIVAQGK